MASVAEVLDLLAEFYGEKQPDWPTDPYLFLVWWHCGYPASDAACAKGWQSLKKLIGTDLEKILSATPAKLAQALKPGGMVPELRAMRLREIVERILKQHDGDLLAALKRLPAAKARAALKQFPNIADPGADRILLFAGISPMAAVPSNGPHVLVRIQKGPEVLNYGRVYQDAQKMLEEEVAPTFDARTRAYLLLKHHGQQICKRTNPKCGQCPLAPKCSFFRKNEAKL